jgi:hypothetical protein
MHAFTMQTAGPLLVVVDRGDTRYEWIRQLDQRSLLVLLAMVETDFDGYHVSWHRHRWVLGGYPG